MVEKLGGQISEKCLACSLTFAAQLATLWRPVVGHNILNFQGGVPMKRALFAVIAAAILVAFTAPSFAGEDKKKEEKKKDEKKGGH